MSLKSRKETDSYGFLNFVVYTYMVNIISIVHYEPTYTFNNFKDSFRKLKF